jgi:hypothetical protein
MRPPECAVCAREFGPTEGALVTFAPRPSDTEWRERSRREGFVGHPPNVEWFCGEHAAAAQARAGETIDVALGALRAGPVEPPGEWPEFDRIAIRPIAADALAEAIRQLIAALATEELTTTSARDWTPMDNTFPPYCPYVDSETLAARPYELQLEWAHFNDTELARTSAMLSGPGFTVGGHGDGGEVTELLTSGELPAAARQWVERLSLL